MLNFQYYNPANIYFGKGQEKKVGELVNQLSWTKKILVLSSGEYIDFLGIRDVVETETQKFNIQTIFVNDIVPNPKLTLIHEMIALINQENIDFILAVGGGSVIDSAKAIALGANYKGSVWEFFEGKEIDIDILPIGVISTMASSGSEMSNATIVSHEHKKLGVEDNRLIPQFSILNPAYTCGLPEYQTGVGVSDILTHLLERYFSNSPDSENNFTDHLLEGAIAAHMANSKKLLKDLTNYELRAEVMWSSTMAHNNILECGREPDWASHRIEHELSAQYGIIHGEGMAIIFPAWMEYVSKKIPEIFVKYTIRVFKVDPFMFSEEEIIKIGIEETKKFFESVGMKSSLSALDISQQDFELMALRATKDDKQPVGHLLPLYSKDIIEILKLAL